MLEELKELTYLKQLCSKYGANYLHRYFGFSLLGMSKMMGISTNYLSEIVKGKKGLPEGRQDAFIKVFNDLKIVEKTKDFHESADQLWLKEHWAKQALVVIFFLTINLVFANMLDMEAKTNLNPTAVKTAVSFYLPSFANVLEYIFSTRNGGYFLVNQFKGIVSAMGIIPLFFALVSLTKKQVLINLNLFRLGFFCLY